jgi:TPR repeat protein
MRRQDIQLLASARQGDIAARCEAGRRYLLGIEGFPHHVATGLDYLTHPSVRHTPEAAKIIAESLALEELLSLQQEKALAQAAQAGSAAAQLKLGVWECLRRGRLDDGARWLETSAANGHAGAQRAWAARDAAQDPLRALLRALGSSGDLNAPAVSLIAAQRAFASGELEHVATCLGHALALAPGLTRELSELVVAAVCLAEERGQALRGIAAEPIRASLELCAGQGDRAAAYALGRGLCGIACAAWDASVFADNLNMRKGVAFLLRAADAGCDDAWLHLYELHAHHRLSVANPQLARFFLEKAAARGQSQAQRKLGALMLRDSTSLAESEPAIEWLHQAARQGDAAAQELLHSLVLPVQGRDEDASSAIEQVRRTDLWLAVRLELARDFGLTKLEALCVDPAQGLRPWGLVVGKNPFITQARLSAPRAVPAVSDAALAAARRAASFFGHAGRDAGSAEGDLRRRSMRLRRALERHGLDDSMFFANASSTTLESLRLGPKWAFRAKQPLRKALAGLGDEARARPAAVVQLNKRRAAAEPAPRSRASSAA